MRCSASGLAGDARRRHHAGQRHRRRALDVVVERGQPVAVALEQVERVAPCLKSSHCRSASREALRAPPATNSSTSAWYASPAQPRAAASRGTVVVQQLRVVGAHVEADGQRLRRMDAGRGGVERELADRDAHAARALVAEAEDALVVGDDDQAHVVERRVAEHLVHAAHVVRRDPEAARRAGRCG